MINLLKSANTVFWCVASGHVLSCCVALEVITFPTLLIQINYSIFGGKMLSGKLPACMTRFFTTPTRSAWVLHEMVFTLCRQDITRSLVNRFNGCNVVRLYFQHNFHNFQLIIWCARCFKKKYIFVARTHHLLLIIIIITSLSTHKFHSPFFHLKVLPPFQK